VFQSAGVWRSGLEVFWKYQSFGGYEQMVFITVHSLLGSASRPNGNDRGKDPDWGGGFLYKDACFQGQS